MSNAQKITRNVVVTRAERGDNPELEQALRVLSSAMRGDGHEHEHVHNDEQINNADGYTAKLNKLMATKEGRARLRAALESIDDETDEDDEIDEEVTANASAPLRSPSVLLAPPNPERHAQLKGTRTATQQRATNRDQGDAPLGMTPASLLAKNKTEAA